MTNMELQFILQKGEGFKIEFKERLSSIDKDIVAFANAEGGRIYIGISDDNKVKGIILTNKALLKNKLAEFNPIFTLDFGISIEQNRRNSELF